MRNSWYRSNLYQWIDMLRAQRDAALRLGARLLAVNLQAIIDELFRWVVDFNELERRRDQ